MTDRSSKLSRANPTARLTGPLVATIVIESWIILYGIPNIVLTDSDPQFVSKFIVAVSALWAARLVTATKHHPQIHEQVEWYSKTLVARLRHYIEEHQIDWDMAVQPFTCGYNTQANLITQTSSFSLILSRNPPGALASQKITSDDIS